MFSTVKQKLLLGLYVFILLSIPVGAYLASQSQNPNASAKKEASSSAKPITKLKEATPSSKLLDLLKSPKPVEATESSSAVSFGPTLSFRIIMEGRPKDNQSTKLFVGIVQGTETANPEYLLTFTVDLPRSGIFSNLSLAGLTAGNTYTAVLKGPAQIATSSAFLMTSYITNLNNGSTIYLKSGDLNEDNIVNSADYAIAKSVYGTNTTSLNWNDNADFNRDGVVNSVDLALIVKNMGTAGETNVWSSTPASGSATLEKPEGARDGGYWIWVPDI